MSKPCKECKYYTPTDIFELCDHSSAIYYSVIDVVASSKKAQQHTVGHMRRFECGSGAALFIQGRK